MPDSVTPFPVRDYLHPKYWPTWLGLGFMWLVAQLPYPAINTLGKGVGLLSYALMPARRRIVRTNLRLAFPEYDKHTLRRLVRENFHSTAMAIFESGLAWWGSEQRLQSMYRIEGLENLKAARAQGKGVLLLGGHYTTLEISGKFLANHVDNLRPTYKRAHNPLFEAIMVHSRNRMLDGLIRSRDMRDILRNLKNGKVVWYAPDQDFGERASVFAPFMGIQTATLTLTARIAKSSGAPLVPFYSERLPGNQGYRIRIGPAIDEFPTGDDVRDATLVNQAIEEQVRRTPAQYLWAHRRFRTRPDWEPQLYRVKRRKAMKQYTRLLFVLSPVIVLYTLWTAFRNRDQRYLRERFAFGSGDVRADIHLHAASIGELNAALPLIRLLQDNYPQQKILLTTNTPSSRRIAEKQLGDSVKHHYLPIDFQWTTNRFMPKVSPQCQLIMETELWPNLYEYCFQHGIRNIIVNGRLSKRTTEAPRFVRNVLIHVLQYTYAILARTEADKQRFEAIWNLARTRLVGNIKYAQVGKRQVSPIDLERPYVLAASTRNDEEKFIVENWLKLDSPRPLLVIAPRHIQRLNHILDDLKSFALNIAVRSRHDPVSADTDVYIADTFGELDGFIAGAEFVLMGGGFKPHGGQNILEVARAGKAVIFGQHMDNFQAEARDLVAAGGGIQIDTDAGLVQAIGTLLEDREQRARIGANARALIEANQDMAERYLDELRELCPKLSA
ncbi:LpxL/LpxP family Kdo(2)-lipid IV(A) lauroyl/palmitoleoyl acyltransferase [Thiohalophilus sp.]|uniref:LpxL/LpxP family Kdo(2)-lipid IV(A) lauroyl/palmitoleoyl acyltransferase n=1 Tax=Thiohalophilus sp. TaxID=3028392 RepID=UPI002ACE6816|nr:LpxL/LpxP family Kdo(2)-lipid IV(A) lauroyl/palmitoleoyl acyltransferase [Thiohalophilus sp.]MDZ7805380.1 LpxL/LpxP family Kdo(2)-lipid IV(A) lauroyl/palmitoleoyl acyltransferase [Thiohalophilus sp.]